MNEPQTLAIRILYDALIVGLVLFAPWYATLFVAVIGLLFFQGWYDVAGIALFYDALYNTHPESGIGLFGFALILVFATDAVRVSLRSTDDGKLHFK